ncbi:PTS sugar transporter subunit IIA [Tractidigestivibacter sp.]|uniref:PTS sugar transporter subunit IIA n=1 Tax=Tractidigestivibacter sp. TaxID=2847320 RepID=UPI002A90B50B|nr:PTS sugar transporter subunit IIA [Tractidigestivibacter sp.]MDY5272101.1 PTS sugar transporter subunit IIA [Tractidigestivibacter sp.]
MLDREVIMRELTVIDLDASCPDEIFDVMGKRFNELGYVNEKYIPSIKKRESMYPTALPVEPHPIAIPHTKADAIVRPFIAPVRLRSTIAWGDMSDPDNKLDVKLAFMLGFYEPGAHIELLQILMHNFQRADWVNALYAAKTEDEFFDAVIDMEWWHD